MTVKSGWWMAHVMEVAEWRCVLEECGAPCVMIGGMMLMLQLSASSWVSSQKVNIFLSYKVMQESYTYCKFHLLCSFGWEDRHFYCKWVSAWLSHIYNVMYNKVEVKTIDLFYITLVNVVMASWTVRELYVAQQEVTPFVMGSLHNRHASCCRMKVMTKSSACSWPHLRELYMVGCCGSHIHTGTK